MSADNILIYGAYGYTGALIAERAVAERVRPILAGRSEEKLRPVAERLGLPERLGGAAPADAVSGVAALIRTDSFRTIRS